MNIRAHNANVYWNKAGNNSDFDVYVCDESEREKVVKGNGFFQNGVRESDYLSSLGAHMSGWYIPDAKGASTPEGAFIAVLTAHSGPKNSRDIGQLLDEFSKIRECDWAREAVAFLRRRQINSSANPTSEIELFVLDLENNLDDISKESVKAFLDQYSGRGLSWVSLMMSYLARFEQLV